MHRASHPSSSSLRSTSSPSKSSLNHPNTITKITQTHSQPQTQKSSTTAIWSPLPLPVGSLPPPTGARHSPPLQPDLAKGRGPLHVGSSPLAEPPCPSGSGEGATTAATLLARSGGGEPATAHRNPPLPPVGSSLLMAIKYQIYVINTFINLKI